MHLNVNIAAINAVMSADTLTVRTDPLANEMAPQTTMATDATTTVDTAPISTPCNGNDVMCIDTAIPTLSMNNVDLEPPPLAYSPKEVQQLLEDTGLEGWQAGFEEGHRTGRKTGHEEGKEDSYKEGYEARERLGQEKEEKARRKGHLEGYRLGTQDRKGDEH
jgi:flagellar biosynthesis/type III secretory pathway protein FliH